MSPGGNSKGSATQSETLIRKLISTQLAKGETLLEGVRFTDPKYGDVEVDFLILIPDVGVAVVEVKGGVVSFQDGQWLTKSKGSSRRISPIEQARKGKHALRRFLDRSTEWKSGSRSLIRSQWFVAMPYTDIDGDMGSEGRREQLLGVSDLTDLMPKIRRVLSSTLDNDTAPSAEEIDLALTLLLRTEHDVRLANIPSITQRIGVTRWKVIAVGVAVIGALTIGGVVTQTVISPAAADCNANYEPCLPVTSDLSCSEIRMVVQVVGEDPYGLDRDGDGFGCEIYK